MRPEDHLDENRRLDLLSGHVSRPEADVLFAHLRACPACEEDLRRASAALEGRRAGPLPRRERSGRWTLPAKDQDRPRGARRRRWSPVAALVAAVLVALALWIGHRPADPGLFWIERDADLVALRSVAGRDDALAEGLAAYARRDATRAVELLAEARVAGGPDEIRRLYLASALLHQGRAEEAADLIAALDPFTLPAPWRGDALWTLHAALQRAGRGAAADSLRERMGDLPGPTGQGARRQR